MADQSFIIVDGEGTEHEFPAGFDPKQAAEIVRARTPQPTPAMDPEMQGMMEMSRHPKATAIGGALAAGAAAAPWAAMGRTALQALESPVTGAITGGYEGYKRDGIPGALMGAIGGAGISGLLKGGAGYLRAATAAKAAEAAANAAAATPNLVTVATPGLGQMLARPTTGAAVRQAEQAALRNQLLHQLASQKGAISPEAALLTGGTMAGLAYAGKKAYDRIASKTDELNHKLNPFQKYADLLEPPK